MLEVSFTREDRQVICTFRGHCGYAEHGKDIVCAAASALFYTLYHAVRERTKTEMHTRDGVSCIRICLPRFRQKPVLDIVDIFYSALRSLAQAYPDNVTVSGTLEQTEQ